MLASRFKLNLGLALLVLFSIGGPFKAAAPAPGAAYAFLPPTFSFLAAPILQATSYPPPPTEITSYPAPPTEATIPGYPELPTATLVTGYPGSQTATPGFGSSPTPVQIQTGTTATPTLENGTPSQNSDRRE